MYPDELVIVSAFEGDRPRLGIVIMSRVTDKTLVSFGKAVETVDNENILEVTGA